MAQDQWLRLGLDGVYKGILYPPPPRHSEKKMCLMHRVPTAIDSMLASLYLDDRAVL